MKTAKGNPQVYMDIKIGNKPSGRIVMQLRADIVPRTAGLPLFHIVVINSVFKCCFSNFLILGFISHAHTHSWLSFNQPLFPQSQRVGPGRPQAFGETFGSCWSDVIPISSLTVSW